MPLFFLFAFGFSWLLWYAALRGEWTRLSGVILILGGFGPALSAFLLAGMSGRMKGYLQRVLAWRVRWHLYAFATLLPAAIYGLAAILFRLLDGSLPSIPPEAPPLVAYPALVVVISLVGGGQEELGWRALALPELQARMSPLIASVILGMVWALWHLPLFLSPHATQSQLPVIWYVANAVGLSVIMTWLYNASGGSALLAMLLHGAANVPATWYPLNVYAGGVHSYGLLTCLVWLVAVVLILRRDAPLQGKARFSGTPDSE